MRRWSNGRQRRRGICVIAASVVAASACVPTDPSTPGTTSTTTPTTTTTAVSAPPTHDATSTSGVPIANVGEPFDVQLVVPGGTPSGWALVGGSFPDGLSMSPSGRISGVPTAAATGQWSVQVSPSGLTARAAALGPLTVWGWVFGPQSHQDPPPFALPRSGRIRVQALEDNHFWCADSAGAITEPNVATLIATPFPVVRPADSLEARQMLATGRLATGYNNGTGCTMTLFDVTVVPAVLVKTVVYTGTNWCNVVASEGRRAYVVVPHAGTDVADVHVFDIVTGAETRTVSVDAGAPLNTLTDISMPFSLVSSASDGSRIWLSSGNRIFTVGATAGEDAPMVTADVDCVVSGKGVVAAGNPVQACVVAHGNQTWDVRSVNLVTGTTTAAGTITTYNGLAPGDPEPRVFSTDLPSGSELAVTVTSKPPGWTDYFLIDATHSPIDSLSTSGVTSNGRWPRLAVSRL